MTRGSFGISVRATMAINYEDITSPGNVGTQNPGQEAPFGRTC